ncbi:MAG: HAD family hydrolase [Candidatus Binatia bacterium]|nr:HAD family hydrolase [Candidatus Binatia bacterium]
MPTITIKLNKTHRPLRGVAFDLDSTLTRPHLDFQRLRQRLGTTEPDILQWLRQLPPAQQVRALHIIEEFEQDGVANVAWNEGAQDVLQALRAVGLPLAIVTRNSRTSLLAVCAKLGIEVDVYVARDDAPPKPDPACLYYAAQRLRIPIDGLLMVGDFRHDIEAGRAAGAMTVLLTNGTTPPWSVEADVVIARLPELLSYIEVTP